MVSVLDSDSVGEKMPCSAKINVGVDIESAPIVTCKAFAGAGVAQDA